MPSIAPDHHAGRAARHLRRQPRLGANASVSRATTSATPVASGRRRSTWVPSGQPAEHDQRRERDHADHDQQGRAERLGDPRPGRPAGRAGRARRRDEPGDRDVAERCQARRSASGPRPRRRRSPTARPTRRRRAAAPAGGIAIVQASTNSTCTPKTTIANGSRASGAGRLRAEDQADAEQGGEAGDGHASSRRPYRRLLASTSGARLVAVAGSAVGGGPTGRRAVPAGSTGGPAGRCAGPRIADAVPGGTRPPIGARPGSCRGAVMADRASDERDPAIGASPGGDLSGTLRLGSKPVKRPPVTSRPPRQRRRELDSRSPRGATPRGRR